MNTTHEKWLSSLQQCELFQHFNKDQLAVFLQSVSSEVRHAHKNDIILHAGQTSPGIGVVLEGRIAISKENAQGLRNILTIVDPGAIYGEIAALSQQDSPATISAQSNCAYFYIDNEFLPHRLVSNDLRQTLMLNTLFAIASQVLVLNKKLDYLTIRNLRARLSTYLVDLYNANSSSLIMLELNRVQLSDYLGVSRPSLSREMVWLRNHQIIDFHGNAINLLDIDKLRQLTDY